MSFLLLWTLRASGVIGLGLGLALPSRRRSAATRVLVLRLTLASAILVPLAGLVAPRVEIAVPTTSVVLAPAVPRASRTFHRRTSVTEGWSVIQPNPKDATTLGFERATPFSTGWVPAVGPLFVVWSLGTGLLMLRWFLALARLRRVARAGEEAGAAGLKSEVQMRTEVRAPGEVWLARVPVPMTFGRTILLPQEARDWPESRVRAAILHEMSHVARHDWHWQTLAALFAAVHWTNPLVWLLARALRDAAEAAADDAVLAQGVAPSAYARELLAVAASVGPTGPALAMARRGGVKDRVAAILATRDRSRPSRPAAALFVGLLAATGIGIAGLARRQTTEEAPPRRTQAPSSAYALHAGGTVRLVALRAGDRAWQPDGTTLPRPTTPEPFRASPGKRIVTIEFERTGQEGPDVPGIPTRDFLHHTGKPMLLNDASDEFEMVAPNPRNAFSSNGGSERKEGPNRTYTVRPTFSREMDSSLAATDVRVRLSSGPAIVSDAPVRVLETERVACSSFIDGRWYPGVRIRALVPKALRGKTVLLRAFDAKGLMIEGSSPLAPFPDGTTSVTYDVADPKEIARFQWAHRTPEFVEFKGVRLRPGRPTNPVLLAKGRSVELAGVWTPDGAGDPWRPDGSPGGPERVGNFDGTVPFGRRAVQFAFRVRGSGTRVPTVQVRPAYPGATFASSSLSLLREEPNGLLVWVRTMVPEGSGRTDLEVSLKLDADEVGPPLPLGTKRGQATVQVTNVDVRANASYAQLRVTPHVPMDPIRFWYGVSPVDARGGSPESFGYEGAGPTFRISMAHPERAVAWRLWKAPREHVRFEGVRLRPNP